MNKYCPNNQTMNDFRLVRNLAKTELRQNNKEVMTMKKIEFR